MLEMISIQYLKPLPTHWVARQTAGGFGKCNGDADIGSGSKKSGEPVHRCRLHAPFSRDDLPAVQSHRVSRLDAYARRERVGHECPLVKCQSPNIPAFSGGNNVAVGRPVDLVSIIDTLCGAAISTRATATTPAAYFTGSKF